MEKTSEQPYLSVIIPVYNEARRLPTTLLDVDRWLATGGFAYEIIVVDDGSHDATADVAEKMQSAVQHLHVLRNEKNRGKGAAVRQGMLEARGAVRLFTDADNATSMDEFPKLQKYLNEGFDVVFASRAVPKSILEPPQPFVRRTMGKLANLIIQVMNLPGVHDTQCGFKAFTAPAATTIFNEAKIDRFGFDVEALVLARTKRYRMQEVGVRWVDKAGGTVTPLAYLQVFWENLRIRWWLLRGAYGAQKAVYNQGL